MSGYNEPLWSRLGASVSPLTAKVFMVAMPRTELERVLDKANVPASVRAEALATWDTMKASALSYNERVLGDRPRELDVEPVERLEDVQSGFMSADAAGAFLGLSGRHVRGLVKKDDLPGEMHGNRMMVERAAVEALAIRRAAESALRTGAADSEAA